MTEEHTYGFGQYGGGTYGDLSLAGAQYQLLIDLDGSGVFGPLTEDVTSDVIGGGSGGRLFTSERGRDQIRMLAPPRAGGASFQLNNQGGQYGGIDSDIAAGKLAHLRARYNGVDYPLHTGIIDLPSQLSVGDNHHRVGIRTFGTLSRLPGRGLSTALYQSIRTEQALQHLLDAAAWPKNLRPHLVDELPAGYWSLGRVEEEVAGPIYDRSAHGNDGTVTLAGGSQSGDALDDLGDGSIRWYLPGDNLVTNPSAENDTTGWTVENGATVERRTDQTPPFGAASLRVTADGSAASQGAYTGITPIAANTPYVASMYLKGTGTVRIYLRDNESTELAAESEVITLTSSWTRYAMSDTGGASSATARCGVRTEGTQTATVEVDGVQFEVGSAPTSYIDGSRGSGYGWSGTAHASASYRLGTSVQVPDDAAISDVFEGGGALFALIHPDSGGESEVGRIAEKGNWWFTLQPGPAGSSKLGFVHLFTGSAGNWETTNAVVVHGRTYAVAVNYDGDSPSNHPTVFLCDLVTQEVEELSVGSGLTQVGVPTGTRSADAGPLYIGNMYSGHATWDGLLDELALFRRLLSAADFSTFVSRALVAPRRLDRGQTTMDWWWLDEDDAFGAMTQLLATEGPGAVIYEDGNGALVFKNRHARLTESRSTAVADGRTFRSNGEEPLLDLPFSYDPGLKDVVNSCEITVARRAVSSEEAVWHLGAGPITFGGGEVRTFTARTVTGEPMIDAVTPVADDYTLSAGAIADVSLDRTNGVSITITITAGPTGAVLTELQLRAKRVAVAEGGQTVVRNTLDTAASQKRFGLQMYRYRPRREIPLSVAQDFANAVVGFYQDGRPSASVTIRADAGPHRMAAALSLEVGDRIHVTENNIGIDGDFTVEQIRHDISSPAAHVTVLGLETAVATNYAAWDDATWDNSIWGW